MPVTATKESRQAQTRPKARAKLLLLDDDQSIIEMLSVYLKNLPCEVVFVTHGLDALREIFKAYKSDAPFTGLVLDCALPQFDGFTIAKIVRVAEETGFPPTKIAFFTAYGDQVEQSTLLQEVKADAYFRKPEDVLTLPDMIAEWLKNEIS